MKRNIGLRTVLLMLVFAAVAPGLAVVIYSTIMLQRDELQRARDELHSVTKLAAATQEQWIDGVRQILTTVASGPSVRRSDLRGLCTEFLRNVKAASPTYTNIGVLDLNGRVQCEALESDKKLDRSNRYYFQAAVESRQFSVGDFVVSYSSGNNALGFGMPVFDYAGVLSGVAFSGVDLDYPSKRLEALALPKQLHISVSDIKGTLLATSGIDHNGVGKPVSDPTLRAAMIARTAKAVDSQISGEEWLHAVQPVEVAGRTGVVVAVSVRKADALAIADSYFRSQLIIMLVASMIGFLLALFLAQRTLWQPIARLLARMREVERSGGTDMAFAPPNSNSEFAEIDAVFDSMMTKLRVNQLQLIKAQQITRVGFYQLDLKENLYTASPIVYEILGLDPAMGPVTIAQYQAMLHPDDRALVNEQRNRLFEGGEPLRLQYRIVRPNGEVRWIDGFGFVEKDRNGKPSAYSGAIQDITDRMLSEQDTRNIEKRFQLLFENSLDGVLQTSPDGTILAANAAACDIFGWNEEQLRQRGRAGVVLTSDPRLGRLLEERKLTGKARGQLTMVRADGSLFEAELTSSIYADARGDLVNSMVLRDISDRIKSEQHIHRLAFFDALTDLPNRRLLMDRLEFLLASAQRSGLIGAVLFLDLDHFKNVNDARGHAIGDALLQQVARRLAALMRTQDTVARMGGDEFVVLLPDLAADFVNAAQSAMVVAEKLRHALTQPFSIENQQYLSGGSIGVTLLPKVGQTADDLLREADTAMYRAKQAGRNRIAFFEAEMQIEVEGRLGLEHDLAQAIGTAQLEMLVQPQYDCNARAIGAEMLMRWTHPVRGPVSPVLFIPIAEESGLILALGDWVLRQGCIAVLRLEAAGQAMPISINVSPLQFRQPDFVARVRAILSETGAPASQLIFEVTEGLLIDNLDETILRMRELVALGIRFSIDDFGTGYSSLAYLRQLPLYELKIDRSFVMDTPVDPGSTAIVQSILAMAGHLGLHVVAEGVETTEQAKFLQAAGCAALQGYLFARPMPLERLLQHELQAS